MTLESFVHVVDGFVIVSQPSPSNRHPTGFYEFLLANLGKTGKRPQRKLSFAGLSMRLDQERPFFRFFRFLPAPGQSHSFSLTDAKAMWPSANEVSVSTAFSAAALICGLASLAGILPLFSRSM